MLKPEDFLMPLEKQLKMRLVEDDIDKCTDVKTLQANLKVCAESLMKYQHLLGKVLEAQLTAELENWAKEASTIVKEADNKSNA